MLDTLEWAKKKKQKAYHKTQVYHNSDYMREEYEQWNLIVDKLMRYETLVDRTELLHKLECLEKFNNADVPLWAKNVIKGINI